MPSLTITNLSTDLYYELKRVAEQHHRSINSEVLLYLEEKLQPQKVTPEQQLVEIQALRTKIRSNFMTAQAIEKAVSEGRS